MSARLRPTLLPCLLAGLTCACGTPQVREPGWDQMVFTDDEALEPVPYAPPPRRPARKVAAMPVPAQAPEAVPPARCDNERDGPSRSVGQATAGALESGCRIPAQGLGYLSVNRNLWGTDEMVAMLQFAAAQVARQYPGSPAAVIGALSAESGGHLKPHKSHQSGRDVDIAYFLSDGPAKRFVPTHAGNLDPEKTWAFLEALLYTGEVAFVFMDYDLQAVLYGTLLDVGWSEEGLGGLFQYPAGPTVPRGVIRHARGHADHFHVRFRCPAKDKPDCVD